MSNAENGGSSEVRRKQLLFRCQHRGFREVDLIFGAFAAAHLSGLDANEREPLAVLLNAPDDDVYAWLRGYEPLPARYAASVFDKLKSVCNRKFPAWTV